LHAAVFEIVTAQAYSDTLEPSIYLRTLLHFIYGSVS